MAEARDHAAWNRTFAQMAQISNLCREKDSEAVDPMIFYPWSREHEKLTAPPPTEEELVMLREAFPGKKGRTQ